MPPTTPLLGAKAYDRPSVFEPANLLREGRRQLGLPDVDVPDLCILDPDGDLVRHLRANGLAERHPGWACYHTTLWTFDLDGRTAGVIDRALRDEGTSLHYLPPSDWSHAPERLLARLAPDTLAVGQPVVVGPTWTTDAPYRETETAIARAANLGVVAVEMEAAALYAYAHAHARDRDVLCIAHVTNTMATAGDDFEKGDAIATIAALDLLAQTARALAITQAPPDLRSS